MVGNSVRDIDQALTEEFTLQNFTNDFVEKIWFVYCFSFFYNSVQHFHLPQLYRYMGRKYLPGRRLGCGVSVVWCLDLARGK